MKTNTEGWFPIYDVKDQCGRCANTVEEHRMQACMFKLVSFPAAHNCPRFSFSWDGVDDHK